MRACSLGEVGEGARPRGAIVVFPTIMNQTPNALRRLPMLAEAGTLALCADLYGRARADVDAALAIMRRKRSEVPRDGDEVLPKSERN